MKVAVIGAGSWGTALAIKAVQAQNPTVLYHREPHRAAVMRETRKNPDYLTDVTIPDALEITSDWGTALADASIVLLVTPSAFVRETLQTMRPYMHADMYVVCCSKGLERGTGKRMSQVMEETVGDITTHLAILSGPNHAEEIAINLPAATVIGCPDEADGRLLQKALSSDTFRVYTNQDMIGVELCGTTKNIIALAAGLVHGLSLGDNAVSALLTRGLHEMTAFGLLYGAQQATYSGLAGMGDLIATCMSGNSRNRRAGVQLASGLTMDEIIAQTNMVVEGFNAVLAVHDEAQRHKLEMPITEALYKVIHGKEKPWDALHALMRRESKNETIFAGRA